jgi:VCBS repeat-containing protein
VEYWASPVQKTEKDDNLCIEHLVCLIDLLPNTTYNFRAISSDGIGNVSIAEGGTFTTDSESNILLSAQDDIATTQEDNPVTINILANDIDPDNDILTITETSQPENGTAQLEADGTVTYTPDADYNGTDSFNYTVSDGLSSSSAVVTITVAAVNDTPVAQDDYADTTGGTSVTIDVLANDSDVDGDSLIVKSVSQGNNGTVEIESDTRITYTPAPGFSGTDVFTYTATDDAGESATATVTVDIASNNTTAYLSIRIYERTFLKWSRVSASVTVKEDDASGLPLVGATVTGHWNNGQVESGTTDKKGKVLFKESSYRRDSIDTLTIDIVILNNCEYDLTGEIEESIR